MAVFVGKMTICVENVMESTDKLLEPSSDSARVRDTTSYTKYIVFLSLESESELKYLVRDHKNMNYVGTQPTRDVKELWTEDHMSLVREHFFRHLFIREKEKESKQGVGRRVRISSRILAECRALTPHGAPSHDPET